MRYRIVNVVIVSFILYFFTLPFWSGLLRTLIPHWSSCPYRQITGAHCPFCGITADLQTLLNGGAGSLQNPLTVPLLVLLGAEMIFRVVGIRSRDPQRICRWIPYDIAIHVGLLLIGIVSLVIVWPARVQ